ncbi:MAG: hypothetical protein ABWZ80_07595, partial [Beijerinckiaceae bacterium]
MTNLDTLPPSPKQPRPRGVVEATVEKVIFNSRWLLAPFYLALVVTLFVLLVKMMQETRTFV